MLRHPDRLRLALACHAALRSSRFVLYSSEGREVCSILPGEAAAIADACRISGCGQIRAITSLKEPANDV